MLPKRLYRPTIVVRSGRDAATRKDSLTFDVHLFARGKDISIGHHQVFCNLGIGDDDKELVPEPD